MSGAKEIRTKIKSIQNTQKITRAMEMVAASKMRRAQDRMRSSRPYAEKIRNVIDHLAMGNPEYRHIYLSSNDAVDRVGFIVISTDRGLCGGLNVNLFRASLEAIQEWNQKGVKTDLCLVGTKGESFFKRLGCKVIGRVSKTGDSPSLNEFIGIIKLMLNAYEARSIQRLYLVYNKFESTMSQKPAIQQLLPIAPPENQKLKHWDYIYEPEAKTLLDVLLSRFIESQVYQGVVENIACEQAARMVAMKSASDNANELIDKLRLVYNKARQAAITQEISEIVGGAAAV